MRVGTGRDIVGESDEDLQVVAIYIVIYPSEVGGAPPCQCTCL